MGLLANSKKADRKAQEPLCAISLSENRYIFRELWIRRLYSYLLVLLMQESEPSNWRPRHKEGSLHWIATFLNQYWAKNTKMKSSERPGVDAVWWITGVIFSWSCPSTQLVTRSGMGHNDIYWLIKTHAAAAIITIFIFSLLY